MLIWTALPSCMMHHSSRVSSVPISRLKRAGYGLLCFQLVMLVRSMRCDFLRSKQASDRPGVGFRVLHRVQGCSKCSITDSDWLGTRVQECWDLLRPDNIDERTVVAVAIARLGEPAEVGGARGGGSFLGTGRALSAAAGRLSYVHGLKVGQCASSRMC